MLSQLVAKVFATVFLVLLGLAMVLQLVAKCLIWCSSWLFLLGHCNSIPGCCYDTTVVAWVFLGGCERILVGC